MQDFTQADYDKGYCHLIGLSKFYLKAHAYDKVLGVLLQILCGLSREEIKSLYWTDIYKLDSNRNPSIRKQLEIRNYRIDIPTELRKILRDYHGSLNYVVSEYLPFSIEPPKSDLRHIFARRLFEVNGYSDENVKDLKVQLKIRNTHELLKFCGYASKEEIGYGLQHIDLDYNNVLMELDDKNFNNGKEYFFQSFSSFSHFLKRRIVDMSFGENSIRLMLWLSLYSGIRLSEFLKLTWDALLYFETDTKRVYIKNFVVISRVKFVIPTDLRRELLLHFANYLLGKHFQNFILDYSPNGILTPNPIIDDWEGFGSRVIGDESENSYFEVKESPSAFLPDKIFLKSNFTLISPNNLAREMRSSLFHLGHDNPEKFKANSTLIMWARRILEIKGDHKATIQFLKKHFYFKTKLELASFLSLTDDKGKIEFEGVRHSNKFEAMSFDF